MLTASHPVLTLPFSSPVDHGTHTIDHLLVNDGLFNSVLKCYSLHGCTNLSFHSPIIFTLHLNIDYSSCHNMTTNNPKPKWQESTTEDFRQYANALDKALRNIHIPWEAIQCCDKSCMHYCQLQLFHDAILKACVESGRECIGHTSKSGKSSALTGWNEFVNRTVMIRFYGIISGNNAVLLVMRSWPMSCTGRENSSLPNASNTSLRNRSRDCPSVSSTSHIPSNSTFCYHTRLDAEF